MRKRPYSTLADGALWAPSRGAATTGLILIPPLIGDTATSQLHRFRRLRRRGMAIYTFAYPGHPGTTGRFSLRAAMLATGRHMETAAHLAGRHKIPLFGLGCCAAAIPLLAAAHAAPVKPTRLALLNPLVCFAPDSLLKAFWSYSRVYSHHPLGRLRTLPAYLDHLFPGIAKNRARFGALERRRIALPQLLVEILQDQILAGVWLAQTPVVCCYGQTDPLLQQLLPKGVMNYEAAIRHHCPRATFKPLPAAHFFASPRLRERLGRIICQAFTLASPEARW